MRGKGEVDTLPLHAQHHLPLPGPVISILLQSIILPLPLTMWFKQDWLRINFRAGKMSKTWLSDLFRDGASGQGLTLSTNLSNKFGPKSGSVKALR